MKFSNLQKNFFSIYFVNFLNIILPFIVYPYLIVVLGTNNYGKVVIAQLVVFYLSLVLNFGSNTSATREISKKQKNYKELSRLVCVVFFSKFLLYLFIIIPFLIYISVYQIERNNFLLYLFSSGFLFIELLWGLWFYQGIEKMKWIGLFNLVSKLIYVSLVFSFINSSDDYYLVPMFSSLGSLTVGLISIIIIFKYQKIHFTYISFKDVFSYYRSTYSLFLSSSISQVYPTINKLLISIFLKMEYVAFYDLAEKFLNVLKIPIGVFGTVIFPMATKLKNKTIIWTYTKYMFILVCIIVLTTFMLSDIIIELYVGKGMMRSSHLLNILSVSLIPVLFKQYYGFHLLIPNSFDKEYLTSVIISTISFFSFLYIGIIVDQLSINYLAYQLLFTEFILVIILIFYSHKKKLIKWKK